MEKQDEKHSAAQIHHKILSERLDFLDIFSAPLLLLVVSTVSKNFEFNSTGKKKIVMWLQHDGS